MTRLAQAVSTDIRIQFRNGLYHVGIIISLIIAVALAQLTTPNTLGNVVPAAILLIIGGTTMLYVAGMMIFEKDEGTIAATIVSPLTTKEYLIAKLTSLVLLATLESLISIYGAVAIHLFGGTAIWPNAFWLVLGILIIGIIFTLTGIAVVARFNKITDFLIPMAAISVAMQLPFLYFWGLWKHPALLILPTAAPTMLMDAAFRPLALWEQVYAISYSMVTILALSLWAHAAFHKHIIQKMG